MQFTSLRTNSRLLSIQKIDTMTSKQVEYVVSECFRFQSPYEEPLPLDPEEPLPPLPLPPLPL